eukprot:scaffold4763_cov133-Isochrysis_galbana.AAC.3
MRRSACVSAAVSPPSPTSPHRTPYTFRACSGSGACVWASGLRVLFCAWGWREGWWCLNGWECALEPRQTRTRSGVWRAAPFASSPHPSAISPRAGPHRGREDTRKRGVLFCAWLEARLVVLEWVGVCIGTVPNQNT